MSRNIERVQLSLSETLHFDEVIDVRSPLEFSEDHMSGAVNLPVLSDIERAHVGTIFKQESNFIARKVGAALVSKNIAHHLETHFAGKGKDYRPLVYCWRGGQRSGSIAMILSEIGWATTVVENGYRGYRSHVIETITAKATELSFVVLNGFTGSGKTLLLKELENTGHQVLDLEGIASHKGSVFGGDPVAPQPAQKRFESVIYDFLARFDPTRPVWIEAESAKIGRLNLPNPLWQKMKLSPVIEIVSPLEARAAYLTADYQEWLGDSARVSRTIDRLKEFQARRTLEEWKGMSERGEWEALATRLLKEHYDRRYSVAGSGHFQSPSAIEGLRDHRPDTVRQCALALSEKALDLFARVPAGPHPNSPTPN
ncbi:MAG: tRNA 2-selenouridine(34) synthase MnmH [Verrucomicrobiales bacterium]|jgi:tRNA 2-selenouridine synthase|nr:tRNA 2-selenouridine(34) synthase MnmH [Verrucomicrobiales bacterium]HQZ28648.1 tRNA 2-selenouridine(34) synthase MnmH [Verrucomicrobiales bacterium]